MLSRTISRSLAKEQGLKRYFTGKPCKHGHVVERAVANGVCLSCHAVLEKTRRQHNPENSKQIAARSYAKADKAKIAKARREWLAKNPDYYRQYVRRHPPKKPDPVKERLRARRYYNSNKEKCQQTARAYRAANPDIYRNAAKKYAETNRHLVLAKARLYYSSNKELCAERHRKWLKENRDVCRVNEQNRRARKANAEGSFTAAEVRDLFEKQNGKCAICFSKITLKPKCSYTAHRDHVIPLSAGGSNWIENIQLTCPSCNLRKHTRDPLEFVQREFGRLL